MFHSPVCFSVNFFLMLESVSAVINLDIGARQGSASNLHPVSFKSCSDYLSRRLQALITDNYSRPS